MRRRTTKFKVDTKLIVDTIGASLIVQKAPALINQFFPLDPAIAKIAGVGAGWLTGSLLKRPNISNTSIALGIVDLITPMFDNLLGGGMPELIPMGASPSPIVKHVKNVNVNGAGNIADYLHLNDYVSNPSRRESYETYNQSY